MCHMGMGSLKSPQVCFETTNPKKIENSNFLHSAPPKESILQRWNTTLKLFPCTNRWIKLKHNYNAQVRTKGKKAATVVVNAPGSFAGSWTCLCSQLWFEQQSVGLCFAVVWRTSDQCTWMGRLVIQKNHCAVCRTKIVAFFGLGENYSRMGDEHKKLANDSYQEALGVAATLENVDMTVVTMQGKLVGFLARADVLF